MTLADCCLHEAAHMAAGVEIGAPVLAALAGQGDGLTLFDLDGIGADDAGTIAVAGMSACGWAWIGLSDAVLAARCLALAGHGLPDPGSPVTRAGLLILDGWERRAREILARRALLHARLALLLAARGAVVREDVDRVAGPQPAGGAGSRLWERCREESPGSVREAAETFVFRAAWE